MSNDKQRLFFALWPDETVRAQLAAALPTATLGGRPVRRDNLHLTLVFLGSIDSAMRARVEQAANGVACAPFELAFDVAGYFSRPQVLWIAPSKPPPEMAALVQGLRVTLVPCGLALDTRAYRPHLTLARKVRRPPALPAIAPVAWPVRGFSLVESRSQVGGVSYVPLRSWDLR
jgi:2'-5' RNA ligase